MSANKHFDNLDITRDEFDKLSAALKKDEFRKLFLDYCEEIQDPENRKLYETEIKQLEAERGVDVTFLNPEPGFVVKTSINGESKCFLNIAKCDKVAQPTSTACVNPNNGVKGLTWSIPHGLPPPRDDFDNKGVRCRVFDVIFHPDALYLSEKNAAFRQCLIDTACDGVEREYNVRLDRINLKFPKLKFKGIQRASVIRKLSDNPPPESSDEPNPLDEIYPPKPVPNARPTKVQCSASSKHEEYCKPKYVLKHRRPVDLSEMTYELDAKMNVTIPKELVVEIELPLLKSTADCTLDVTERMLYLISEKPAKYKLNIELPYAVHDKNGSAKFDPDKRKLVITLPVMAMERTMRDFCREDSGVESDVRDEMHSSGGDSPVLELIEELETKASLNEDPKPASVAAVLKHPTFFLKNSIQYTFPQHFDCNALDDVIAIVLHVRNVESESIEFIKEDKFFHVKFTSIGAGYYPVHYAFYFEFCKESDVKIDSVEAEPWDNNIVLSLNLKDFQNIESYYAGLDKTDVKEFKLQEKFITKATKQSKAHEDQSHLEVSVERSEDEKSVEIEIKPKGVDNYNFGEEGDDDELKKTPSVGVNKKHKKKNKKRRSLSESVCDDIKQHQKKTAACDAKPNPQNKSNHNNNNKNINNNNICENNSFDSSQERMNGETGSNIQIPTTNRKQRSYSECRDHSAPLCKGILKHYSRYSHTISDSCSSIDEPSSYSCSADAGLRFAQSFSDIPEENSPDHGLSESCKKTVRFNEVIKKQVFRTDSSILGQRKKNQKKREKKRALQRRHSEGDSVDYEENKSPNNHEQYLKQRVGDAKSSKHDSGLDLSTQGKNGNSSQKRTRIESESSDPESKSALMFDMDM